MERREAFEQVAAERDSTATNVSGAYYSSETGMRELGFAEHLPFPPGWRPRHDVTDDDQRIYMTYNGIIYQPQGGERYWRTTPVIMDAKFTITIKPAATGIGALVNARVKRPSPCVRAAKWSHPV